MTTPRLFPTLRLRSVQAFGLLAVLLASACAPAATSPTPAPVAAAPQMTVTSEDTVGELR